VDKDELFLATITVGELASGIAGLAAGAKRQRFQRYLDDDVVLTSFTVLTFDVDCALRWGAIMGEGRRSGRTPPVDDAKIAAIAAVHARSPS
jgi:predicted nucleic acid-binding protein